MAKAFKGFYSTLKTSNANAEQRLITFTYRVEKVIKMHRNCKKGESKGGRQVASAFIDWLWNETSTSIFFIIYISFSIFFQKKEFYIFLKTVVSKILDIVGAVQDITSKDRKKWIFFFKIFAINFSSDIYRIFS